MNMSYVRMVIELSDFPSVDYESKKDKKTKSKSNFGTPLSNLSAETIKQIK